VQHFERKDTVDAAAVYRQQLLLSFALDPLYQSHFVLPDADSFNGSHQRRC